MRCYKHLLIKMAAAAILEVDDPIVSFTCVVISGAK